MDVTDERALSLATSAELTAKYEDEQKLGREAQAKLTELQPYRNRLLLARDDAALIEHDNAEAALRREIDSRAARAAAFLKHIGPAKAREAEAARKARYDQARQHVEDAALRLRDEYPALRQKMIELWEVVDAATSMRRDVNDDLPEGAEPVAPVEYLARGGFMGDGYLLHRLEIPDFGSGAGPTFKQMFPRL